MTFPSTELENLKKKRLSKEDIVGLTPKQYILYRINVSSSQDFTEDDLNFAINEVEVVPARPDENCTHVAVVKITPDDSTTWKGELLYRIPQIDIGAVYGDFFDISIVDLRTHVDYNALARANFLPPKVYGRAEFVSSVGGSLSYRLEFNNPFFKGAMRFTVTGVENLILDMTYVDSFLGAVNEEPDEEEPAPAPEEPGEAV